MKKLFTHQYLTTSTERTDWRRWMVSLLLVIAAMQVQAQSISLNLSNVTIEEAIDELRTRTDIGIIYNNEELSKASKITIRVTNVTVEEALNQILKDSELTYVKISSTYVIKPIETPKQEENQQQFRQNIRGQVFDKDSKVSLPFATIHLLNTNPAKGTTSDIDGNFIFEDMPVGRYSIKVTYIGYEDGYAHEVLLGSAKELILRIELSEQIQSLGEVTVVAPNEPLNEMASVSAKSFSPDEAKRYAASISDPARMAQSFAGVSGNDDASNEIVIRGNSPNWMLWRLEGVEIPSPNHFAEQGYSSGAVSILSANMLGSSDFYTGAFPAEYSNALSGVFDINLRNGNNKKSERTFQAGVLGIDLSAEGPFKEGGKGSYLFNYRYSTLSILNNLNIEVSENALPNYQDLSFKFNLPTKKIGTFSIWGIGGISDVDEKYLPDAATENLENGYSDYTETGMYAAGVTHTIFPDDKSFIRTVVSQSMSYSSENYDQMDALGGFYGKFDDELRSRATRATSYYNRKMSSRLSMRIGAIASLMNFDYFTRVRDEAVDPWNNYINQTGHTQLYQGYVQGKYKFSDKVVLSAGVNNTYFELTGDYSFEPRAGLTVEMANNQKISFGYGRHSKHENLLVYFVETEDTNGNKFLPNENLKLTLADHYVASYERAFGEVNVKTEFYYQDIHNLPVPNNPNKFFSPAFQGASPDDTLSNVGRGRNYGVELTVQKYFSNNYYFLVTSSLFEAKYQAADGKWRDTRYNINYINNFVGGKEIKFRENRMLGLNAKVIWSGGKRIIPLDLEASKAAGEAVYRDDKPYSQQAPAYMRLDIGARLHFYKLKSEHVLSLDIQNVTNRLNTWFQTYDKENEAVINYPMAGLIPVLSYRIEF